MKPIKAIQKEFLFRENEAQEYINQCPKKYKTFFIAKKSNRGMRAIHQPSRDLKIVQHLILEKCMKGALKHHHAATAYFKGCSIKKNAEPHKDNKFLLKLDFRDFFSSITPEMLSACLRRGNWVYGEAEEDDVAKIFFMENLDRMCLSIGAPSSPAISNAILYDFDDEVFSSMKRLGVRYTRYSDDLSFSTCDKNVLQNVPSIVMETLKSSKLQSIEINTSKTVFTSKKHRRQVTGVIITNEGELSIGRDLKRELRSRLFNADKIISDPRKVNQLLGHIAHAKNIEPLFFEKLRAKYEAQYLALKSAFKKNGSSTTDTKSPSKPT